MTRLLVADDDDDLREVVRFALEREGFEVIEARNGVEALEAVEHQAPDLVVLDVVMPQLDGLEVCRRLRAAGNLPVVMLSTRSETFDRCQGLDLGADDYLGKPFSVRELVSRVRTVLRRSQPDIPATDGLRVDVAAFRAFAGAVELSLTATEIRLLQALLEQRGRVWSREQLAARAYPDGRYVSDRTIDSHVRNLRAKLREADVEAIDTVHGVGFRLEGR